MFEQSQEGAQHLFPDCRVPIEKAVRTKGERCTHPGRWHELAGVAVEKAGEDRIEAHVFVQGQGGGGQICVRKKYGDGEPLRVCSGGCSKRVQGMRGGGGGAPKDDRNERAGNELP